MDEADTGLALDRWQEPVRHLFRTCSHERATMRAALPRDPLPRVPSQGNSVPWTQRAAQHRAVCGVCTLGTHEYEFPNGVVPSIISQRSNEGDTESPWNVDTLRRNSSAREPRFFPCLVPIQAFTELWERVLRYLEVEELLKLNG